MAGLDGTVTGVCHSNGFERSVDGGTVTGETVHDRSTVP